MSAVLHLLWHGLRDSLLMGWEIWWALALGFFISAVVQSWVPRERIQSSLSGRGVKPIAVATGLGAASSSCSYAAVAIAKSLFQRGASAASALAFQAASTNLVWELGLVLWTLLGWQFTLAEYLGGIVMIAVMGVMLSRFVSPRLEEQARAHARLADTGHMHHMAGSAMPLRNRLTSVDAWSDVAHNFRGDWQMLYKEIGIGLLISGFAAQLDKHFFQGLFLTGAPPILQDLWGAFIGPVIAMVTSVCSVGNIPLAAVLWSGGISFAGVIAFILADLVILPIIAIYRKYYGPAYAARIVALMLLAMFIAALAVHAIFSGVGLIPSGPRPTRAHVFGGVHFDYKLVLNVLGLILFAALMALTQRRGAVDPVCGMMVDRDKALQLSHDASAQYFCCEECRAMFAADPGRYLDTLTPAAGGGQGRPLAGQGGGESKGFELKL